MPRQQEPSNASHMQKIRDHSHSEGGTLTDSLLTLTCQESSASDRQQQRMRQHGSPVEAVAAGSCLVGSWFCTGSCLDSMSCLPSRCTTWCFRVSKAVCDFFFSMMASLARLRNVLSSFCSFWLASTSSLFCTSRSCIGNSCGQVMAYFARHG